MGNIRHRDPRHVPRASYLLLLNRNENIIPAVARLRRDQAAAYFMLGETKGTSAGGAAEAGKSLRVPGTNPFFFTNDALQGNRFLELLDTMPDLEVYLMNTGSVGGPDGGDHSKKVRIADSSAIVAGIVGRTIEWVTDPDFGYDVAESVPGMDDPDLLQPRKYYEVHNRGKEYRNTVDNLTMERRKYLASFPGLSDSIVTAI